MVDAGLPRQPFCGVCSTPVSNDAVVCDACEARSHLDCWAYNGGCATYGCVASPAMTQAIFEALARVPARPAMGRLAMAMFFVNFMVGGCLLVTSVAAGMSALMTGMLGLTSSSAAEFSVHLLWCAFIFCIARFLWNAGRTLLLP